jgi:hypothetical protein
MAPGKLVPLGTGDAGAVLVPFVLCMLVTARFVMCCFAEILLLILLLVSMCGCFLLLGLAFLCWVAMV